MGDPSIQSLRFVVDIHRHHYHQHQHQHVSLSRLHVDGQSICASLFGSIDHGKEFQSVEIPAGTMLSPAYRIHSPVHYAGHVLFNEEGQKVGAICRLVPASASTKNSNIPAASDSDSTSNDLIKKEENPLKELAQETERLLETRSHVLERQKALKGQVNDLRQEEQKQNEQEQKFECDGSMINREPKTKTSPPTLSHRSDDSILFKRPLQFSSRSLTSKWRSGNVSPGVHRRLQTIQIVIRQKYR
mmetsp:Transcript_48527/g.117376  ORF Transcript_48527/g.117376 Transcript_48527/m.117376 type:complete len:245 (-) Transcript_48527:2525-3259(-)